MTRVRNVIEDALFGPESAARLVTTQRLLAVAIAVRLALTPFSRFVDVPDDLVFPVPFLWFLERMPPAEVIVALQVVGVVAALVAAARRWPRAAFAVACVCYLVLAGLRASRGKVLHNDLLLLWMCAAFLFAPVPADARDRTPSRLHGWPVRTSIAMMSLIYWFAAYHKLRRSGPAWVWGDNMEYLMRWGPFAGEPRLPELTRWVGHHRPVAVAAAASILALELLFPVVVWWRRVRPVFALTAVVLHLGTWVLLGLDYSVWIVTVPIVLIDWSEVADRLRSRRREPEGGRALRTPVNVH
jgi:hypothetical protein